MRIIHSVVESHFQIKAVQNCQSMFPVVQFLHIRKHVQCQRSHIFFDCEGTDPVPVVSGLGVTCLTSGLGSTIGFSELAFSSCVLIT